MKRIVTLFALILSFSASADIKFFQGTWDEALQKAKETQKPIFVDFYATWCRPCKYMSKKVFTDSEVSDFYNKNFIPFKVDAEKEEQALVESVNLKAYPTLGYFNPKGELILAWTGVLETDEMLQKGKQVIQFEQNKSAVEKNPNNIQALTDYLEILRFTDFPKAEKLAKNYLKEVKKSNLDKEENWFFIRYFTADYNTREFKYIAENPKAFIDYDEEFGEYYKSGIKSLMLDAIQQKDYSKIELHKKYHISVYKALKLLKLPEEYYLSLIDMMYYDGIGDNDKFYTTAITWLDSYNMKKPEALTEYSVKIADKVNDSQKLSSLQKFTSQAISLNDNHNTNYAHSYILYKSGNKEEAVKYAELAKDKCKDPEVLPYLEEYLKRIKGE